MEAQQYFRIASQARKKVARNYSRAFSESKESKTQEGRMDSRLRGNDSSHRE